MKLLKNITVVLAITITMFCLSSCEKEDGGCETETVCFGEGNCVEKPIPGTCI